MSTLISMPDRSTPRGRVAAGVRAQLAIAGLSARKAANLLGVSQSKFHRRTTGEFAFDVDELGALANLLGIEIEDFFGVTTKTPSPAGPGGLTEGRLRESNSGPIHYKGTAPVGELIEFPGRLVDEPELEGVA